MNNVTTLEKKWWFLIPVHTLAMFSTWYLLTLNHIEFGKHWSFVIVFALCGVAIKNLFSFLVWTVTIMLVPKLAQKKV